MLNRPGEFYAYPPAAFDGAFLWDFLNAAWTDGASLSDLDGVIERNGHFLGFETKDPGVVIPIGQRRMLQAIVCDPHWTIVQCAKRPRDVDGWITYRHSGITTTTGTAADLVAACRLWWLSRIWKGQR